MDTSKTGSIKSLLLQAWRERWTDVQWGINIKNVLPRGVSGDVYDLADCILQQALVGQGPNNLFLSYLTHCLSAHVVSYGAVLLSIGRYQSFFKPQCILSLLELLKTIQPRISCHGNEEECIALCTSVASVTLWLYSCISYSLTKLAECIKQGPEHHVTIMENACDALQYFNNSVFIKALLYVGEMEDQGLYKQLCQKLQELKELRNNLNQAQSMNLNIPREPIDTALALLKSVENLPGVSPESILSSPMQQLPQVCSLNSMIAIDAILNPASDVQGCVQQLLLQKRLHNLTFPDLYCEIIRSCFMGVVDTMNSHEDLKWSAFTFLKVPHLLLNLSSSQRADEKDAIDTSDLEKGLEKLLTYTPLLDLTDTKSNCDCLQHLLTELCKVNLVTDAQARKLISCRQSETQRYTVSRPEQAGQAGSSLILRAEPTVTSILKTLDSDYSKNQDALLGVLCHMIPGKSFELILSAAAATGKLHSFSTKLIKFNEFNKQISGETGKASQTRALLFDITFLMLCHIAQHYGTDAVTSNTDPKDSFFATWVTECLAEGGKYKCPDIMLSNCDTPKVDTLLQQLTSQEFDFKTNLVKWHEMCINAPMAIKEVLLAWEHGAISTEKVKKILDNVKSRMCCLPVSISAWLCSYINILHHEERLKPINMLNQFMTPLTVENSSEGSSVGSGGGSNPPDQNNQFYKERSTIMASIIKKMMYDLHPPAQSKLKSLPISHGLTVRTPLWEIMESLFLTVHNHGWLDLKTIHSLDTLLCVGGPQWFADTLVRQMLKFDRVEELHRAVDLVFGLFYIDIEQCALALLSHVLPMYLHSEVKQEMHSEPCGSALARLVVMTTFAALQARKSASALSARKIGKKRSYRELELEEMCEGMEHGRLPKLRRGVSSSEFLEDTPFGLQASSDDHIAVMCDPLNKAIADVLRILTTIAVDSTISQHSLFPVLFLEQVILCQKEHAKDILQFMPLKLVPQLVKTLPEAFSYELILAVSNMQTNRARKVAARTLCQLAIHSKTIQNLFN